MMERENSPFVCELPTVLLEQMNTILSRFKCPFRTEMIEEDVCRFYIDMHGETARKVLALLEEQIEEEGLNIARYDLSYCYTVPCELLWRLVEELESGGRTFSVEAVDSDTCHVITDLEFDDYMEMLFRARDEEEKDPGGARKRRRKSIPGFDSYIPKQQTGGDC